MALLTPISAKNTKPPQVNQTFMSKKKGRLPFYEDIYSKGNSEEVREGRAHICESEGDSQFDTDTDTDVDSTFEMNAHNGSGKPIDKPQSAAILMKELAKTQENPSAMNSRSGESEGMKSRQGQGVFNFLDQRPVRFPLHRQEAVGGFKLNPTINQKPPFLALPRRKLTPQPFGMFATSSALLLDPPNTAKEAMEDMLGTALREEEDDSFTLVAYETPPHANDAEQAPPTSTTYKKVLFESAGQERNQDQEMMIDSALNSPVQEAFDGDVEDNDFDDTRSAIRATGSGGRPAETLRSTKTTANDKRKRSRKPALSQLPARSSARLVMKASANENTKQNRSKMLADPEKELARGRASLYRKKGVARPSRVTKVTKRAIRVDVKSGLRLRNWEGKEIGPGEPIVVVFEDEVEDVDDFARM